MNQAKYYAVVPAAGVGKRMQADKPKQYLPLAGKAVLEQTLTRLLNAGVFEAIAVAVSKEDPYWPLSSQRSDPEVPCFPQFPGLSPSVREHPLAISSSPVPVAPRFWRWSVQLSTWKSTGA